MRNTLSWVGLAIVITGAVLLVAADVFGDVRLAGGGAMATLVSMTALLVVIGGGALGAYRGKGSTALQHAAIWLAILAVLALVYTYRDVLGINVD